MLLSKGSPTQRPRRPIALTMGMFDGVHAGHRHLIDALKEEAAKRGLPTALMTYDPHPRIVLGKEPEQLRLLTTLDEKLELLTGVGLDFVFVIPFDKAFSQLSPSDFLHNILIDGLNTKLVMVGEDHRFASRRAGDVEFLQKEGKSFGLEAIGLQKFTEGNVSVSSSLIREIIAEGDMTRGNAMLGAPYLITGEVVPGDRIGRTLGYPTANLHPSPWKLYPTEGVYLGDADLNGTHFNVLISLGSRPTLQRPEHRIEIHLLDYQGPEFYGQKLLVEVFQRIRGQLKLESLTALTTQMQADEEYARLWFATKERA
jgi:riboflavin kinase / FMN adenylyltransferase